MALQPGDRIVIEGTQHVLPGKPVTVKMGAISPQTEAPVPLQAPAVGLGHLRGAAVLEADRPMRFAHFFVDHPVLPRRWSPSSSRCWA